MKNLQRGFTLIELMIVVAIIGILAAVGVPMYLDYAVRAQVSEGLILSSGAKAAVTEFYQDSGGYPADNNAAGLSAAVNITGKYVQSVSVASDEITILYGKSANAKIDGKTVVFSASDNSGSVSWACASGGAIPDKHLPTACR